MITSRLVIAWVHAEDDDAVLTVSRSGGDEAVYRVDIHDPAIASRFVAADVRVFVRAVLDRGLEDVIEG